MNKKNTPFYMEHRKVLADHKRLKIKVMYRNRKRQMYMGSISIMFALSGLYLIYWKFSEKVFDLNFYLIMAGTLYSIVVTLDTIKKLLPSYIKSKKKEIYEIGHRQ